MKAKRRKPQTRDPEPVTASIGDGLRLGDPIPGSRYVRGFCFRCKEPIRVPDTETPYLCRECDPPKPPGKFSNLEPAQKSKLKG